MQMCQSGVLKNALVQPLWNLSCASFLFLATHSTLTCGEWLEQKRELSES